MFSKPPLHLYPSRLTQAFKMQKFSLLTELYNATPPAESTLEVLQRHSNQFKIDSLYLEAAHQREDMILRLIYLFERFRYHRLQASSTTTEIAPIPCFFRDFLRVTIFLIFQTKCKNR